MIVTVDSNILLSIFAKDSLYEQAAVLLEQYSPHDYILNDVIYLELAVHFGGFEKLNQVLNMLEVALLAEEQKNHASTLRSWIAYLKNRKYHCPDCGKSTRPVCSKCGSTIKFRQRILADFMIGTFSQTNSDAILTFDTPYYRNYFPKLRILE